jgi:hypothetical protein
VEAVKRIFAFAIFALTNLVALANVPGDGHSVLVYGKADRNVPGWAFVADVPSGWTADCCTYARAIGVNLVMYRGEWSGEPERVMVLNVWPRKLASLKEELAEDRKQYLQRDPAAKMVHFPVRHRSMRCEAVVYEGTDHFDDAVVFCDPGAATRVRISWSMTFADGDPQRQVLLENFMRVVVGTIYMRREDTAGYQPARR